MHAPLLPSPTRGDFMMLRADTLRLLLPQAEVGAAEYLAEQPMPTGQAGGFEVPGTAPGEPRRRAAALSARMTALPEMPVARFVLTSFPQHPGVVLAWDEVRVLVDRTLAPQALPAVMRAPESPLVQYVDIDGEIAFCASARQLLAHAFDAED